MLSVSATTMGMCTDLCVCHPYRQCADATRGLSKTGRAMATKPSTHPPLAHLSLADLARLRLEKRANPTYSSLEEFFYIRGSCHLIEEIQGDFYCDCRDGIKGHI